MTQLSWKTANGKYNPQIISGDGIGYYQYLVNYFYNGTIEKQEDNSDFMMEYEGRIVNKCFVGAAICMAPFYKVAEFHSFAANEVFDPFSPRTKKWINLGSLVYLFLGLAFIFLWLRLLKLKEDAIFWSLLGISIGSNLFLYSVLSPSMTHVYSFFSVSVFLFFTSHFFSKRGILFFLLASFFLGLIVVIRPINGVVLLLLPLLSGSFSQLFAAIKSIPFKSWLTALVFFGIPLVIQLYLWYLQTGTYLLWSYGQEGFYWSNPQIFEVLFGFRKGWFVYTPLVALALFSLPLMYKKNKEQFLSLVVFLAVLVYIVSSWWNWMYGSSLGQRSFVDFYAVIAFLLATLLDSIYYKRLLRMVLKVVIVGCIGLNLFQSFQYKENIISSWDMTAEKYLATFGVSEPHLVKIGGSRALMPYNVQKEMLLDTALHLGESNQQEIGRKKDYFDYSNKEYGLVLKYPLKACFYRSRGYYLELEVSRLELVLNSSENAKMVIEIKGGEGDNSYYTWFLINEVPAKIIGKWTNYTYQVNLPKCTSAQSQLSAYIRNEDKSNFLISKFEVKLYDLY